MNAREIVHGVQWMGAHDFDRRLFDELIPLPDGTSYNAYLVRGSEKTALIDTADPAKIELLIEQLSDVERIDYLVVQHVEQDHSGGIPWVLERFKEAQIITSPKAKSMIVTHLHVPEEKITTVEHKETLSLGDRTLEFLHAQWVHWPETMLTYLQQDKILFTCDLFGSHLATTELYADDRDRVYPAAKRYYAEIMMPFATFIERHLEMLRDYDIKKIAPSHGPVHNDAEFIQDAYRHWVLDPPRNLVLIPHVSMHGSTKVMVEHLTEALAERGVAVEPFNMTVTDLGRLAEGLVDAATVILATPTVLAGPHPSVISAAYLANALRPKLRNVGVIGSYGWGGKTVDILKSLVTSPKVDWFDPILIKGLPQPADLQALDRLADEIAARHKDL